MTNLKKYQNKKIAIYGMGKTGFSAAKIFKKLKAKVYCWDDSKIVRKKVKKLNFKISKFWLEQNLIDKIVISPGININSCKISNFLKKNFSKIITDLDIFFELNHGATIISITGTNGKSTTCKIIEKILKTAKYKVKTVGNIGNPILSLKKFKKRYIFILEVSSYQLEYSKIFRSQHAAILNISPDHLERHKSMNNYIKVKSKIFFAQKRGDFSYINYDDKYSKIIKNIIAHKKLKSKLVFIKKIKNTSFLKKIKNNHFKSGGNIENLSFAYKIVKNFKINDKVIIKAINKYKGLPHRQEVVFSKKNLVCINDSKATSFDACLQSLLNYQNIYWIVGGLPKYKDRFNLKNLRKKILRAYIIGKNSAFFKRQISRHIPYVVSKNIKNAISDIHKDLKLGKKMKRTILLSPAAASFDQFSNFEQRGNYFKNLALKQLNKRVNV